MNLLQFIFGEKIFIITTFLVKIIFYFKKIKYGKNFVSKGFPIFRITNPESITIKDNSTRVNRNFQYRIRIVSCSIRYEKERSAH